MNRKGVEERRNVEERKRFLSSKLILRRKKEDKVWRKEAGNLNEISKSRTAHETGHDNSEVRLKES